MKKISLCKTSLVYVLFSIFAFSLIFFTGCGKSAANSNTDISLFEPILCPGTLTGSNGVKNNIVYAAIQNAKPGAVNAWVTDKNGKRIADLQYKNNADIYEIMIDKSTPGNYTLWYKAGADTASKTADIQWGAALPMFSRVPSVKKDSVNNDYVANNCSVSAGNTEYYLRIYSGHTTSNINNASIYAQEKGEAYNLRVYCHMMPQNKFALIIANSKTGGQITSTARYVCLLP